MAEVTHEKDILCLHVGLSKGQGLTEGHAGTESGRKSIFQRRGCECGQLLGSGGMWSFQAGSPSWHMALDEGGVKGLVKSQNFNPSFSN